MRSASRRPQILVVEDSMMVSEFVCDAVRESGCDVVGSFGWVDGAYDLAHASELDAALVDLNLHGDLGAAGLPYFATAQNTLPFS